MQQCFVFLAKGTKQMLIIIVIIMMMIKEKLEANSSFSPSSFEGAL